MSSAAASRFQAAGAAAALSVATAQRQNDMRRMQASRESAGPVTPRAARPPAPAPPVEVSATELEELKLALQSSTDMLKKSEEQLRTERKARSDIEAKLDDLWMIEQGHRARAPPVGFYSRCAPVLDNHLDHQFCHFAGAQRRCATS